MHVRRTRRVIAHLSGSIGVVAAIGVCVLVLAGCGSAKPKAATVQDCGVGRTAANVPVEVEVYRGTVSCSTAMSIEKSYAKAIVDGDAPGNGGGGPVTVSGWTCQGFSTPQLLKTGDASKCARKGTEILEILRTSS